MQPTYMQEAALNQQLCTQPNTWQECIRKHGLAHSTSVLGLGMLLGAAAGSTCSFFLALALADPSFWLLIGRFLFANTPPASVLAAELKSRLVPCCPAVWLLGFCDAYTSLFLPWLSRLDAAGPPDPFSELPCCMLVGCALTPC